ncbi:PIN domain-containing protein [Scytonema sp. UIC 10036]|nr:PIN domain-containing protein [Scytonema sp. UIC 10036]
MSQIIVLDTHIWIWFINQEFDLFPPHWREAIETADKVGISPVSCYEVALAQQRGRLNLPCIADRWFQEALEPTGITLFPLTAEIAHQAVNLSPVDKDHARSKVIKLFLKTVRLNGSQMSQKYPLLV